MKLDGKKCSRCQKFKSAKEFYRQGDRLESLCKSCKRQARNSKREQELASTEKSQQAPNATASQMDRAPKSYEDLEFTKEDFLEIVDYFKELLRLDRKERSKE